MTAPEQEPLSAAERAALIDELARQPEPGTIPSRIERLRDAIARTPRGIVLRSVLLGELAPLLANDPRGERAANVEKGLWTMVEALDTAPLETDGPHARFLRGLQSLQLAELYRVRVHGRRGANLERAIELYEQASALLLGDGARDDWARARSLLAGAYILRLAGERAANFERAIACCYEALEVQTGDHHRDDWGDTMVTLALTYLGRVSGERAENRERLIECLTEALTVRNKEEHPEKWAEATSYLGRNWSGALNSTG